MSHQGRDFYQAVSFTFWRISWAEHAHWIGCNGLSPLTFLDFSDFGGVLSCALIRGFYLQLILCWHKFERTHKKSTQNKTVLKTIWWNAMVSLKVWESYTSTFFAIHISKQMAESQENLVLNKGAFFNRCIRHLSLCGSCGLVLQLHSLLLRRATPDWSFYCCTMSSIST